MDRSGSSLSLQSLNTRRAYLRHAVCRIVCFLGVTMPAVFLILVHITALALSRSTNEWQLRNYWDSVNLMASAITGGAIICGYQLDEPSRLHTKVVASSMAATGVSLFAFMVAALKHSVMHPVLDALALGRTSHSSAGAILWLGALTLLIGFMHMLIAMTLGPVLAKLEGWEWNVGFEVMTCVVTGGGLCDPGLPAPQFIGFRLMLYIAAVWALGLASFLIAVASEPLAAILEGACRILNLPEKVVQSLCASSCIFILFISVFMPLVLMASMGLVAMVKRYCLGWHGWNVFWSSLPCVSSGAATVGPTANESVGSVGTFLLGLSSAMGFFSMTVAFTITSDVLIPVWRRLGLLVKRQRRHAALLMALTLVVIPTLVLLLSFPLGALMSSVEGWPFIQAFWWVVSAQLGGGVTLTPEMPTTPLGRLFGILSAAWSFGIAAISVELCAAPMMEPTMDMLGMTLPSLEEIKEDLWGEESESEESGSVCESEEEEVSRLPSTALPPRASTR